MSKEITLFDSTLHFLSVHQFWPRKKENFKSKKYFYIRCFLMIVSTIWLFFAVFARVVISLYLDLDNDITETISMSVSVIGQMCVTLLFAKNHNQLEDAFLRLSDTTTFGTPPELESAKKKLNFYSKVWYYFLTFGLSYYFIYNTVLTRAECQRKPKKKYEVCGIYTQVYLPFEFDYFPMREIVSLLGAWSNFMIGRACMLIQYICYEIAEQISVRCRHLEGKIHEAFRAKDEVSKREKFENCITYHLSIIRLSEDVSACFETIMFFNVIMGGIVLACVGYAMIAHFNMAGVIHFSAWFVCLYLVCMGGQTLIDSSAHVAQAAFEADWHKADPKLVRDLKFLIGRAQKPLYIKFRLFGFLKLELFVAIVKTAYSYLMLLRRAF